MRVKPLFMMFIFLAGMLFANPAGLGSYVEPQMQVDAQKLQTAQEAYLVNIEGEDRLVLVDGKVVEDVASIQKILEENILSSSGFDSSLELSREEFSILKKEINASHLLCAQWTGLDNHDCYDRESCIVAAFAVPQASMMINADGFWETMMEWNGLRTDTKAQVSTLDGIFAAPSKSAAGAKSIEENMKKLQGYVVSHNTNKIALGREDSQCLEPGVVCYEYCKKVIYDSGAWDAQVQEWGGVQKKLTSLDGVAQKSSQIAENTVKWLAYTKSKASDWTAAKNKLETLDSQISSKLSGEFKDSALDAKYAEFSTKKDEALKLAGEGRFYVAFEIANEIETSGNEILSVAKKHEENIASVQKTLSQLEFPLSKLANEDFNSRYAKLEAGMKKPVDASKLQKLVSDSKALEQEVLADIARKTLSGEISMDEIAGEVAKEKLAQAAEQSPITAAASCPLPTLVFGVLGAFVVVGRRKK